jgi:hypothetical protein
MPGLVLNVTDMLMVGELLQLFNRHRINIKRSTVALVWRIEIVWKRGMGTGNSIKPRLNLWCPDCQQVAEPQLNFHPSNKKYLAARMKMV